MHNTHNTHSSYIAYITCITYIAYVGRITFIQLHMRTCVNVFISTHTHVHNNVYMYVYMVVRLIHLVPVSGFAVLVSMCMQAHAHTHTHASISTGNHRAPYLHVRNLYWHICRYRCICEIPVRAELQASARASKHSYTQACNHTVTSPKSSKDQHEQRSIPAESNKQDFEGMAALVCFWSACFSGVRLLSHLVFGVAYAAFAMR